MAIAAWPGTVPFSCDIGTLSESDQDVLLRYKPDYGVEKLRRRTSLVIPAVKYQKTMTLTAWDALQSFYRQTLLNGSQPFTSNHPRTQLAITAQFTTMPSMKTIDSSVYCIVSIEYVILPTTSIPTWVPLIGTVTPVIYADIVNSNVWASGATVGSFTTLVTLGGSFTRAAAAYMVNSSGVLVSVASGIMRFEYDPTALTFAGLLLEGASTNLLRQSNAFTTTWAASGGGTPTQNVTGPDGVANSGWTFAATSNRNGRTIAPTGAAGSTFNFSAWAKAGTDNFAFLALTDAGGTKGVSFNVSTGVIGTLNWAAAGTATGAFSNAKIQQFPNGWYRISAKWTGSTPTAVIIGGADADATLTCTTGKTVLLFGAQLEAIAFPTSYISTAAATVTRPADVLSFPWLATTLTAIINTKDLQQDGRLLALNTGDQLMSLSSGNLVTTQGTPLTDSAFTESAANSFGVSGSGASRQLVGNAGTVASDSNPITSSGPATIYVMADSSGNNEPYGHLQLLALWGGTQATAAQLQGLT